MTDEVLVRAEHICKYFKIGGGRMLHAVEDINLDIHRGETLGLVGESGCGKSTLGRTLMGIYQPTKGKLVYDGRPVDLSNKKDRFAFAKKAQIVFQDPYASLDPRMTVGSIIEEGMIIHNMYDAKRRQERVAELLATVGLNREHANRFPHEFSGGQRQRVAIARALEIEPELIVCEEPISALDVSIQAQVINLLHDLQERMGLTYLFIAHDLNIVKYISDRIAVMNKGVIQQIGTPHHIYSRPANVFVATFIGHSNLFHATLSKKDGRTELCFPSGYRLPMTTLSDECTDGQEVVVGIRPEEFSVSSEGLTCDVLNRTFLGRYSNYFLHFADGMCVPDQPSIEFSQDLGHTQTLYQPGDHLTLRPNPDKINVFTADMEKSLLKDVIRYEQA